MIAIVTSRAEERSGFYALCESRAWVAVDCDSVHAFKRLLRHSPPRVVLTRHKLVDGYSDEIMAILADAGLLATTRIIVLLDAGTSPAQEARQVALGADYVHRDPIRTEVLFEYLAKYRARPAGGQITSTRADQRALSFAGTEVLPLDRVVRKGGKTAMLTPREIELLDLLATSADAIVTYQTLYSEILGRRFRGETANMRVLLGKLVASFESIGCALRAWIEVIPKTGYRYRSRPSAPPISPKRLPRRKYARRRDAR